MDAEGKKKDTNGDDDDDDDDDRYNNDSMSTRTMTLIIHDYLLPPNIAVKLCGGEL